MISKKKFPTISITVRSSYLIYDSIILIRIWDMGYVRRET